MTLLAARDPERPDGAHVVAPPLRTRLAFWVLNRRVHPAYRPWAAAQLARPDYFRRQKLSLLAFWLCLVAVPRLTLPGSDDRFFWLASAPFVVFMLISAFWPRPAAAVVVMYRYHGTDTDGAVLTPVSAWALSPLRADGLIVLIAGSLVLGAGVAVLNHDLADPHRCSDAAGYGMAVEQALNDPSSYAPTLTPLAERGSLRLHDAKSRKGLFVQSRYVAGYVSGPGLSRRVLATWEVVHVSGGARSFSVSNADEAARQLTPGLGASSIEHVDRWVAATRRCAQR